MNIGELGDALKGIWQGAEARIRVSYIEHGHHKTLEFPVDHVSIVQGQENAVWVTVENKKEGIKP